MRHTAVFALVALVPAATHAAAVPAPPAAMALLCGGGLVRLPFAPAPRKDEECPAKACHAGCSRKRVRGVFDSPQ